MKNKLNFGCGKDIKKDYWNVDIVKLPGVNQVINLDKTPYPFKDEQFSEIYADNVLEHLENFIPIMQELHRILKKNGKLFIKVPHYLSHDAWAHPQHTRAFSIDTFDFFVKGTRRNNIDGRCFDFSFSNIKRRIIFEKGLNPLNFINYIIEPIFNLFPEFYERSWLSMFPCSSIDVEIKK
jgi:SAM-dependent methyltransferase